MSFDAPVPPNETQRLEALKRYKILDTPPESQFDEIVELAANITGVPIALVSLLDENRQWFKSKKGLSVSETARNISFCQHTILGKEIFEVEDATKNNTFKNNPLVTGSPNIKFYAGAPLTDQNGFNLGTLCVIDNKPHKLDANQKKSLELLAKSVVNHIRLQKQNQDLVISEKLLLKLKELNEEFLISGTDKKNLFNKMLQSVLEVSSSKFGFIGEVIEQNGKQVLRTLALTDISWNEESKSLFQKHEDGGLIFNNLQTLFGFTISSGKALIANDPSKHPYRGGLPNKHPPLQNYMGLPINDKNKKIIGMVGIANKIGGFSELDKTIMEPLISAFSSLIKGAQVAILKQEMEAENEIIKNRLLDAQSIAKIGNWEFNTVTGALYWSLEHYKIFELENTPADKLYQAYADRLHPDDLKQLPIVLQDSIDNGNDLVYPHRVIFPDGRMKYLMGLGYAIKDKTGKVVLIKGTCQDITEAKNLELILRSQKEELKETSQYLKTILNATEYSIIATEIDGTIKEFNRGAELLLGYSREEVVGKITPAAIHDLEEVIARADILTKELGKKVEPGFDTFVVKAREKHVSDVNEWTYIRKNQSRVPIVLSVTAIRDENNVVTGYLGIAKDITIEKEKSAQIEKANREIQRFFDLSLNPLCVANTNGNFEKTNAGMQNILGYSKDELQKKPFIDFVHPDDINNTLKEVENLSKGKLTLNFKNRYRTKSGDYRWFNWSASPDTTTGQLYGTAQDITDEYNLKIFKEAEEQAINQSVLRVEYLLDGSILTINKNFELLLGYEENELVGLHRSKLIFTEDLIENNKSWQEVLRGNIFSGELRRQKKNSEEIWIKGAYVPVKDLNGHILKIVKIAYDITDMKQAIKNVEDYKNALDQVAIVAITDEKGKIKYANDKFCQISKYSRAELIGKDHNIINSNHHPKSFFAELWRTIACGNVWHGEIKNRAKDGAYYWVDSTIIPFIDNNGKIFQYVAIRTDITERKKTEEKLQKSLAQLDQFAYVVSHDLKAPLRAIATLTSFLEEDLSGKLNEESVKNFLLIKNRSQRLEHLINDILNYSKIGRVEVSKETFKLNELINEVINDLDVPTNIQIKCNPLPSLLIEKVYITQIFSNLITNAIKYNNKEEGRIEIGFIKEFHRFHLWVKDNGPGIEKQFHQKIFQLFQTIEKNESSDSTGIGLSIVKKIVELLEGEIYVESEPGNGTTFRILLSNKYLV